MRSTKNGTKRYAAAKVIAVILICCFVAEALCGCGKVTAGTAVNTGVAEAETNKDTAKVTWFDGTNLKKSTITVSTYTKCNTTLPDIINKDKTCTMYQIKVDAKKGNIDNISMQILMQNHDPIFFVGQTYDGAVYSLGGDIYGFEVPNGFDDPLVLKIGNVYYAISKGV